MPRRTRSRNLVPRGSFAIAGAMAGFYPVDSPGGWNILGRTNATLWNPDAEPPNRFAPGDVIEIRPASIAHFDAQPAPNVQAEGEVVAEVIAPGQLTTIVGARDWKRANYGVSPGGAFDAFAAALANRAVGNVDDAPLLECVLVAPRLRFAASRRAAFCDGSGNVQTFMLLPARSSTSDAFTAGCADTSPSKAASTRCARAMPRRRRWCAAGCRCASLAARLASATWHDPVSTAGETPAIPARSASSPDLMTRRRSPRNGKSRRS